MRRIGLIALGLALVISACTTTGDPPPRGRQKDSDTVTDLALYEVEIDRAAVAAGAKLLFTEPPPEAKWGYQRRAQGLIKYTDGGKCVVRVVVGETAVQGGKASEHRYTVLDFEGKLDAQSQVATRVVTSQAQAQISGEVTEVRLIRDEGDRLTVQAFTGARPMGYVFHFRKSVRYDNVPFPP